MCNSRYKLLPLAAVKPRHWVYPGLFTALLLCWANPASSYPYTAKGGGFSFGGSTLTLLFQTTDNANGNKIAPVQLAYYEADNRLCITGDVAGTYSHDGQTDTAIWELRGYDKSVPNNNSLNTQGLCYSSVSKDCQTLESGDGEKCTYEVPTLGEITANGGDVEDLLSGRLVVRPGSGSGVLSDCNTNPVKACDFLVGIHFENPSIPPTFFPASVTVNNDPVLANQVLYANEVCFEYLPENLGLDPSSPAITAKSSKIRSCEGLAIKADWCSNLGGYGYVVCDQPNSQGQLATGGTNVPMGDFVKQTPFSITCVDDVGDFRSLGCEETNIAACSSGTGLIEMPSSYSPDDTNSCSTVADSNPITMTFSSPDGGGSDYLNVTSIQNFGSPGNPGDNTIPPCTSACIVSTPSRNEINDWNFSGTTLIGIGYIDARNGDDILVGSNGPDTIRGGSGADTISGVDGNDVLQGGDGTDTLNGDNGNDLLLGYDCFGPNADCSVVINNGSDNDTLNGGEGNDCLDGGAGNDTETGGPGSDAFVLFGKVDNDTITDFNANAVDEGDVIVDLTGSATATWVQGKRGAPSVCEIVTGGDHITLAGISSKGTCESTTIVVPSAGGTFPTQCTGHAYTFQ